MVITKNDLYVVFEATIQFTGTKLQTNTANL